MGASGILDRLLQIRPKLIFADNGALYNGKIVSQIDKLQIIVNTLDSDALLHLIIIPRITSQPSLLDGFRKSITWNDFLSKSTNEPLQFEQVEFNYPVVIVYSSGTTGKPKCIVHSHGVTSHEVATNVKGYLLQMKKEHIFHGDLVHEDITFQFTSVVPHWTPADHRLGGSCIIINSNSFSWRANGQWWIVGGSNGCVV
jgi:acetoacetyl-CoA synthetase